MLKNSIIFAVSGLVLAMLAPQLLPLLAVKAPSAVAVAPIAPPQGNVQFASAPSAAPEPAIGGQATIQANANGQYTVVVTIDGQPVRMMVDTGATMVTISARNAEKIGAVPDLGKPVQRVSTANGVVTVTPTTLRSVSLEGVYLGDVEAQIAPANTGEVNLLGMSFLKRLTTVEQRDGWLILKQ